MIETPHADHFVAGDKVKLILGTYQGTAGTFLRYRDDPHWADITEDGGRIRSHPMEWLAASGTPDAAGTGPTPG